MENTLTHPYPQVALLIVDMQETFLKAIANHEALSQRVQFAIDAAQQLSIPTYFTEQVPNKLGPTHPNFLKHLNATDRSKNVFKKTAFSSLQAEGFETALVQNDIHHLLIAGIETPICVYQTVIAAQQKNIQTTVLTDCIGGRRPQDASPVLEAMRTAGAYLLPSETVFYSILGNAQHPQFRDFTRLVIKHG